MYKSSHSFVDFTLYVCRKKTINEIIPKKVFILGQYLTIRLCPARVTTQCIGSWAYSQILGYPGARTIKLFTVVIYRLSKEARVVVTVKPFQPSQVFACKAGAYPNDLLASPTNTRQGWKGMSGTNTLAYYESQ